MRPNTEALIGQALKDLEDAITELEKARKVLRKVITSLDDPTEEDYLPTERVLSREVDTGMGLLSAGTCVDICSGETVTVLWDGESYVVPADALVSP